MPEPLPAYLGDESYVFVSYSHGDREDVFSEIRRLQDQGVNVWYDLGIHPGNEWSDALAQAIKSASLVLYFITPQSVASENCRQELNFALAEGRRVQAVHLVPTDVPDGLRLRLDNRQAILKHNLTEESYWRAILLAIGATNAMPMPPASATAKPKSKVWAIAAAVVAMALMLSILVRWLDPDGEGRTDRATLGDVQRTGAIAVLPLVNLSGDPAQQYVGDGMTAELINELGRLDELTVISQTSVMRYKEKRPPLREIADALSVDWILEGSVAREGDAIRVNVNLIDAHTDTQAWSGRFDRRGTSMLALRSDVAGAVANELRMELVGEAAPPGTHEVVEEAYDAYLRGLATAREFGTFAVRRAALEEAVQLDPDFAEAWSALSGTYFLETYDRTAGAKAREFAERAIALDPELAEPHAILAQVAFLHEWNTVEAFAHIARARELNRNDKLTTIVSAFLYVWEQRFEEALEEAARLRRIDPLDPASGYVRVELFHYTRLYERALAAAETMRNVVQPGYTNPYEDDLFAYLGRFEDAANAHFAELRQCGAQCAARLEAAQQGWTEGGHEGRLRAEIAYLVEAPEALLPLGALELPSYYASLGEFERSLQHLAKVVEARLPLLSTMHVTPQLDGLRMDPRFDELVGGLGLPHVPDSPARLAGEGRAMALTGRSVDAVARIQRALDASPGDERMPRWLESMAWAHFGAGDYREAARWASRALAHELSPHAESFAHLLLASSWAHLGQRDDAARALADALDLWPGLEFDRDLRPLFLGGDVSMHDRYAEGLRLAGLGTNR